MEHVNITTKVLVKSTDSNISRVSAGFALGLVQIIMVEDQHYNFEDLCGDMFNPEVCPDIPAEQLAREKRNYRARVNRNGVHGVILQCRANPVAEWVNVDSCWGFVGMEFVGSGTDNDFVSQANEWLFANADLRGMQESLNFLV